MKKFISIPTAIMMVASCLMASFLMPLQALAATGQVYISPGSAGVTSGDTLTVTVRINPGTTVDGVQGTLTYDAGKLQYTGYSAAGSPFSVELSQSQSAGKIDFARGNLSGGVSGDSAVETVTFKALTSSGSSSLGLSGVNATSNGSYTNPASAGATVNFSAPPQPSPQPSPSPSPTPSPSKPPVNHNPGPSPSPSPSPSPNSNPDNSPAAQVPPARVDHTDVGFNNAVFHLISQSPTKVYIRYGLSSDSLVMTTTPGDFSTQHDVTLDGPNMMPGETYHYVLVTVDQNGKTMESTPAVIKLKGMNLKIAVFDSAHRPLVHKKVELHSDPQTTTTDDKGYATFTDVTPGEHQVIYQDGKHQYAQTIDVSNNITNANGELVAPEQEFSVAYDKVSSSSTPWLYIGLAGVAFVILVGGFLLMRRRSSMAAAGTPVYTGGYTSVQPTAVPPQFQTPGYPQGGANAQYPSNPNDPQIVQPNNNQDQNGNGGYPQQ